MSLLAPSFCLRRAAVLSRTVGVASSSIPKLFRTWVGKEHVSPAKTFRFSGVRFARYSTNAFTYDDLLAQFNAFAKDDISNVSSNVTEKFGRNLHLQSDHPLGIIKEKVQAHFGPAYRMFDRLNPFVTVEDNFDALLIPKDHESRRPSDTYYINRGRILRPHTSAHQCELIRAGHRAFLAVGDVYRRDEIDQTHFPVFHQMEGVRIFGREDMPAGLTPEQKTGWVIDHMKATLEGMVKAIFGPVQMRWVDAYFPFTDPSFELEIFFDDKWLEVLGCGMIHRQILKNCGLDDIGWAFGIGLERLAMVLFGIPDIRLFWSRDPRFLDQFKAGKVVAFQPFSKYPPCIKDITFWIPDNFSENDFNELVRSKSNDMVESVKLIDKFRHPKTGRSSHCYRLVYRSMDRNLTNDEINLIQEAIRVEVVSVLGVVLR